MEFTNTIDYHRKNPDVSLSEYYRMLRLELASSLSTKKKIYLDTKFWVLLRNGSMNPNVYKQEYYLLQLALKLVENGTCIFPISEDVFIEVTRQTDKETLLNTVKLIDLLSQGVSTISHDERIEFEVMHFLYSHLKQDVYLPQEMVWTKLSYTMGFSSFSHEYIADSENLVIQKAFTDHMWSISLVDQIKKMLENRAFDDLPKPPTAENINLGQFAHANEASSFKQMFMNEVSGWIDFYKDLLCELMEHCYSNLSNKPASSCLTKQERDKNRQEISLLIYNIFRLDKIGTYLPSARITSSLYAAVRWDKKQKFQDHDFHDFRHASAALPYFDHFFTEKRLTHLVTQKHLQLDQIFKCQVCSKLSQAIDALESMS
ncbi:hypothetical protein [Photobacterium leiognathi]|uniref:hypothetical protein n=1 Tax=Photobacterium leiognathi TaxID=553611 RepID=UPI002982507F|nr:hypothetical protein [Photobacterium leiognathi]